MIEIYTDGSCWPNNGTGNGTCGFVAICEDKIVHQYVDGRLKTTNNRMELLGVITALKYGLKTFPNEEIKVYSDSQYVVRGYNTWSYNWFEGKGKANLINRDMWEYLHKLRGENLKLSWIKGHDLSIWNNYVDNMCNEEFKLRYGITPEY